MFYWKILPVKGGVMKRRIPAIVFSLLFSLCGGMALCQSNNEQKDSMRMSAKKLFDEKKYDECLKVIDERLAQQPKERKEYSELRLQALKELGRYKEAVDQMLEEMKGEKDQSIRTALGLGGLYIKLDNLDEAFKWFHIAVDKGFAFYPPLEGFDEFKPLRTDIRFEELIRRMKDKNGLGKAIPDFSQGDISGHVISPRLYKNSVLLLDFWATWCPPCMAEMPNLMSLYNEFNQKGFAIISINLDTDRSRLDKFIKAFNPPWPIIFSGDGFDDKIAKQYNVKDIPSVWLVDKTGTLRFLFLSGEKLREAVKALLDES
jgi:thiol-disulfide isomerase/thioredoxin